mgnify:FL=1
METQKSKNKGTWILWWRTDKEDLKKQVVEYNSLKITKSYRGQSALLLIFSVLITIIFIVLRWATLVNLIDATFFLILAYFIYKGKKWAIISAMILWTFEKGYSFYDRLQALPGATTPSPLIALIWWGAYMAVFYKAYQVEKMRTQIQSTKQSLEKV